MNTPVYQPQQFQDDEIDLFELAEKLWNKKLLIIAITGIVAVIAVAVALLLPPTWQSEARIYMSSNADLAQLNDIRNQLGVDPLTPEDSYNSYYRYITSRATLREVFNSSGLAKKALEKNPGDNKEKALGAAFNGFSKNLSFSTSNPKKDATNFLSIQFSSDNQTFAADLINNYLLPTAQRKTIAAMSADVSTTLRSRKADLTQQIELREQSFLQKQLSISARLEEALTVAKTGGITRPLQGEAISSSPYGEFSLGSDVLASQLHVQKTKTERYRLITQPKAGDQDKPLLTAVAPLYLSLQALEKLDIQLNRLQPVEIDEPAAIPTSPIKPKKKLIVALGVVLGGMLGVFVALIQIAIASRKEKMEQQAMTGSMPSSADATFG